MMTNENCFEVDSRRVFGSYALPIAAPDMVGDRDPAGPTSFDLSLLRVSEDLLGSSVGCI